MSDEVGTRLLHFDLDERRAAAEPGAPLSALADSLSAELAPLLDRELRIPVTKARMTRVGGRCPVHGDFLEFDPFSPTAHYCARCGCDYVAREHDDWWAMGAQLWTVERAVHAATLYLLRGDEAHATLASNILEALADRYSSYPNVDNVLGPSRPFFSTYLESIWLLNACHALDMLQTAEAPRVDNLTRRVIRQLVAPSSALIASFSEGMSNRQVWNEVAVLSALTLMDAEVDLMRRLDNEDGLLGLMSKGLLRDGSWYEGENYHLFAHRGLWYGVGLLRARERDLGDEFLPPDLDERYSEGFVTPFLGVLPDDTFPSRRDSKYGVSMRQWRFAEWCELGYAHRADERLGGILSRLYDGSEGLPHVAVSTGMLSAQRARSTADAERNGPPSTLSRESLSWRALLMADVEPPERAAWEPLSACLPEQGLAVIRRDQGSTYVALEGGHTGGDHGHPDRLSLTLQTGDARLLDDPGTGSYVDRSLHWYRSTLAHAAPLFDGASQNRKPAELLAFEDRGGAGWMSKRVAGIAPGVEATRTVVVCDGYLVDLLEWTSEGEHEVTLPIAGEATLVEPGSAWTPFAMKGAGGLEDGFDFAISTERVTVPSGVTVVLDAQSPVLAQGPERGRARLWYAATTSGGDAVSLVRARVPGAPGREVMWRHWLNARGIAGRIVGVWSWPAGNGDVALSAASLNATVEPFVAVTARDGTQATHARAEHGWHIDLEAGGARSSIDLANTVPAIDNGPDSDEQDSMADDDSGQATETLFADYEVPLVDDALLPDPIESDPGGVIEDALLLPLGAVHYLATEESFSEAGHPTASVQLARTETHFIADIEAATGQIVAPEPDEMGEFTNVLDNERADVNADGVQWYIGHTESGRWADGGLLVPVASGSESDRPRTHKLVPNGSIDCTAAWRETTEGWAMRLVWPLSQLPVDADGCIAFDLIVNERPPERERRRGQLVLSGGGGFAYLRGDRHDPARALVVAVT